MAYSLKSVWYKENHRKILLQNENGPCPLLAAANALLLSARITLPDKSLRNNIASIDDVVNMLAGHALRRNEARTTSATTPIPTTTDDTNADTNTNTDTNTDTNTNTNTSLAEEEAAIAAEMTSAHHIDELLQLFPSLQHGMDVNPKFTLGPTGYEYTNGLGAFDLMDVDLVHGWLVDLNQESEVADIIGSKSYNELVDIVIKGNEAMERAELLTKQITTLLSEEKMVDEVEVEGEVEVKVKVKEVEQKEEDNDMKEAVVEVKGEEKGEKEEKETTNDEITTTNDSICNEQEVKVEAEDSQSLQQQQQKEQELDTLQEELQSCNKIANSGNLVKQFLDTTSHQLTYNGLTELHSHVQEGKICVFFRNNHFATLTKHEGVLYLLVTDLGYSSVKEVVWEKLDDISGDTDLYNGYFCISQVPTIHPNATGGPNLSPEQQLAQRDQAEIDYQLALQISMNDPSNNRIMNTNTNTNTNISDREGDLIAEATERSLQDYNNQERGTVLVASIPNNDVAATTAANYQNSTVNNNETGSDDLLAYHMQVKLDNEARDKALAIKLQRQLNAAAESQNNQQRAVMNRNVNVNANTNTNTRASANLNNQRTVEETRRRRNNGDDKSSGCLIC